MTSSDLKIVLSSSRILKGEDPANGGRIQHPYQRATSGAPGDIWPALLQSQLTAGESLVTKLGFLSIPADNSELAEPEHSFFDVLKLSNVVDSNAYSYWWLGTQDDTGADNGESTADKYGVGTLVTEVVAGVTDSFEVEFYHAELVAEALAGGDSAVIKTGYSGRLDARLTYGGTGNFEIIGPVTVTGITASTRVTFTTVAPATQSYSVGDKFSTLPIITEALKAKVNSIDKTGLTGGASTFDDTGVEVYSNTPRMNLSLEMVTATVYKATVDVPGWENSGVLGGNFSISADVLLVNTDPNYLLDMVKIPANAFNGTLTAGDLVILEIYPSLIPFWQRLQIRAGAASGTRSIVTGSGGQTV